MDGVKEMRRDGNCCGTTAMMPTKSSITKLTNNKKLMSDEKE